MPLRYTLEETPERDYSQRTEWNARDSEGTLILHAGGALEGGTRLTRQIAAELERPILVANVSKADPRQIRRWLETRGITVLNVAGPRESEEPGIYARAVGLLRSIFDPGGPT